MARKPKAPRARRPGYSKVKNSDLVEKLIARGLPHNGRKADLIARLEEDDARKAVAAEIRASQQLEKTPNTAATYRTVYTSGFVTRDNKFHHWVLDVQDSHLRTGYWQFATFDDEQRAHARGLSAPEEFLMDQDRGLSTSDNIILRWHPGSEETAMKFKPTGPASLHLRQIYHSRMILGLPLSSRGQVPVYPVTQDARVKQYWDDKTAKQPLNVSDGGDTTNASTSTPSPRSVSGPDKAPDSLSDAIAAFKPTVEPHNVPLAQQDPTFDIPETQAPFFLRDDSRRELPQKSSVSPFTPPARVSSMFTSKDAAHTHTYAPLSNSSAHNPLEKTSADEPERQGGDFGPLIIEVESLNDPVALASIERPETPEFLKGVPLPPFPPSLYTPPPTRDTSLPDLFETSTQSAPNPMSPSRGLPLQRPVTSQHVSPSPQSHEPTPEFDPEEWGGVDQIMQDLVAFDVRNPALVHQEDGATPADSILRPTSPSLAEDSQKNKSGDEMSGRGASSELRSDEAAFKQSILVEPELDSMDWEPNSSVIQGKMSPTEQPELLSPVTKDYLDIPCMGCGLNEVQGHTPNCYIGNIAFSDNLTVLDHRRLADAVEYFDPGPWTTHFNPYPTPPLEDPQTQISSMADVIRNEDTYKDDSFLHELPDSEMVLLWALKSLPGVHMVTK
ncbi:hypothetical protein NX059_002074 [Plenodomus lindquistii]|nr:hypothetical protein NX059_002074 [Plenodomus lindquistii]